MNKKLIVMLVTALLAVATKDSARGASILWSSSGGSAWLTGNNWTGNAVPGGTDIAQFGTNPTAATGVGINFNVTTNAGTQVDGQRIEEVGAVEITSARAAAMIIGNSSNTAGTAGQFRLNGTTVNGMADVIIRNNSSQLLTIQNTQGTGNQTMGVILNDAINNIVNIDSSGGITISSVVSGAGRNLTLNGNSTGILTLSGTAANTYSGNTTVNVGELDLNKTAAIDAIAGSLAVGDATGAANTAIVKLLATNQINNGSSVSVKSDGKLDIVAQSDTVGAVTLTGGTITGTTGVLTGSSYGVQSGTISGHLGGTGVLTKTTAGTVVLSSSATYTGGTTISGGTLQLTASNVLPDTGTVSLGGGGTLQLVNTSEGTTAGAGIGAGPLSLASSAIIDLSGTDVLHLAASNGQAWTGTLSIWNWNGIPLAGNGSEQILFGSNNTALTAAQLNQINFYSDGGTTLLGTAQFAPDNDGEVIPTAAVPEPSTWLAAALSLGTVVFMQRRRLERLRVVS